MRNKRLLLTLTGAVVFGLIAAVSISQYLANAQAYTKNLRAVVVAKVDIPVGTKVTPEHLTSVQFPPGTTPNGIFDEFDNVVDRVTLTSIVAREPITETKLAAIGATGGLSSIIPEGYRAMTVKVNDVVGVSGFLMPGVLVDVLTIITPPGKSANQDSISKVVLQNIKVLANGQNIDQPKNEREASTVKAVTLQVTPAQAEKLALASVEGRLQLVMRNSTDQTDEQTPGANKRTLLTGEEAMPTAEPGATKEEQLKPATAQEGRRRLPVRREMLSDAAVPAPVTTATPTTPRRLSVEMIEGTKKRVVDFP